MNRRDVLTIIAIGSCAPALSSCTAFFPSKFRFRLTVEVDTPDGIQSGSSVYEALAGRPNTGSRKHFARVRGEAVAVDLPNGKTLFVLIKYPGGGDIGYKAMRVLAPDIKFPPDAAKHLKFQDGVGPKVEIPARRTRTYHKDGEKRTEVVSGYPMLVTFEDIDDPTTVQLVDPDDLSATFGEAYTLKQMTVELTNDSVTSGIEERLEWLPDYYGKQLSGDRYQALENKEKGLSAFISSGVFSAGMGLKDKGTSK